MAGVARSLPSSAITVESFPENKRVSPDIPDRFFERRMFTDGLLSLPDGKQLPYWGFEDPVNAAGVKAFPSPLIRMREGETSQVRLELRKQNAAAKSAVACNATDGMRYSTFDTQMYQWKPRASGTWLYQSHKSSPHDFEMGLYGLLVVDPAPDAAGRPLAFRNGPSYDTEKIWILDDVDPNWHDASRHENALGSVTAEQIFDPKYFLVNGVANTQAPRHADVAVTARAGEKVLIRLLNASFSIVKITLEHFHGSIVSVDGTAIDTQANPWASWIPLIPDRPLIMATGSRHDLLIDLDPLKNPAVAGKPYRIVFEFLDLARRSLRNATSPNALHIGRVETTITVS